MDKREVFKAFCDKENSLPLFLSYKWLNLIAPDQWDVLIDQRGNEINAVFPFVIYKKKGFTIITLPALTPYGGIWIKYPEGQKYHSKVSYEIDIMSKIIDQIPRHDQFHIKFLPEITNWLPFYWKKYNQTTRYTYILPDLSNPSKLFDGFKESVRREIKKAERSLSIESSEDINLLLTLKEKAQKFNGLDLNVSSSQLINVFKFLKEQDCGELVIAKNGDDVYAAALFVWDANSIYYLYGVTSPDHKTSGAMSLIMWQIFNKFSSSNKSFNFEGSMIEGIERFFRGFGGIQVPYFYITQTSSTILKLRSFINDLLQ